MDHNHHSGYIDRFSVIYERILLLAAIHRHIATAAAAAVELFALCVAHRHHRYYHALAGFQETNIIGNNFRHIDTFAFVILVIPYLNASFNRC